MSNGTRVCALCGAWKLPDTDSVGQAVEVEIEEPSPTADQWLAAALTLREHALKFEEWAGRAMCGVIMPNAGPNGEPVACAHPADHLPTPHSWAFIPTITSIEVLDNE